MVGVVVTHVDTVDELVAVALEDDVPLVDIELVPDTDGDVSVDLVTIMLEDVVPHGVEVEVP